MEKLYVLSGLGADYRVFKDIDFGEHEIIHIPWVQPLRKESMEAYAKRIALQIKEEDSLLIGLSFGGMMAIEISKHKKFKKIILISSSKTRFEIPLIYRIFGRFKLNKLIPVIILKKSKEVINFFFSSRSTEEKELVNEMLQETDSHLLSWSLNCIVNWKNTVVPNNVFHIHGSSDRVLPIKNVRCDFVIPEAGHLMIINHSKEVSKILNSLIR